MTTTAEACVEAYLKEQAAQQPPPVDKKTKKQRAALRKQVEALFADDALLMLGRAQLASINEAGKYALPLSELAALPRLKSLLKNQDGEALIRAALEDSELVSISNACVERPLAQDLVQQYDAALRKHVSYIFSDDGLQSCPPGKLRAMLDEDENTLFLPLASVIDIKKIKDLLKNEADKVQACRAAIDAAEPGTLICRVEDHEQGPRVVRTQDLPDEVWACVLLCLLFFCVFVGAMAFPRDGASSSSRGTATHRCRRRAALPRDRLPSSLRPSAQHLPHRYAIAATRIRAQAPRVEPRRRPRRRRHEYSGQGRTRLALGLRQGRFHRGRGARRG